MELEEATRKEINAAIEMSKLTGSPYLVTNPSIDELLENQTHHARWRIFIG